MWQWGKLELINIHWTQCLHHWSMTGLLCGLKRLMILCLTGDNCYWRKMWVIWSLAEWMWPALYKQGKWEQLGSRMSARSLSRLVVIDKVYYGWHRRSMFCIRVLASDWVEKQGKVRLSVWLVEGNQPSVRHNALTKDEDRKHMCACAYTGSLTFYASIHDNARLYTKN